VKRVQETFEATVQGGPMTDRPDALQRLITELGKAIEELREIRLEREDQQRRLDKAAASAKGAQGTMSAVTRNKMVMSGAYCVRGTRITISFLKARHRGGDSAEHLAKDYNLPVKLVRAALRWRKGSGR
jgi:uncharacterized protein (DUF433 family)